VILVEAMKNRSEQEHLRAYTKLRQHPVNHGLTPCLQKLDNEASMGLKRFIMQKAPFGWLEVL
jgi:hypothetical protein